MLQQNKLLVDFLVIIRTALVFGSVGPGSSLAGYTIALCLHSRNFCPLAPLYLRCVTGYLQHILSRGEWSASAYRNWDECRVGALLWFPLFWIRYGDSKRWHGMKQDFRPNWYQSLHNPPSAWKNVPHHKGLRPLLFTNSSVGYFMSHKNQNSELKGCKMGRTVFRPYQKRLECVTISICHNKGITFSSVILRPWQPRPQGSFPWLWRRGAPPTKPGKIALGTRLRTWVLVRLGLNPRPPAVGTPLYKPSAAPKGRGFAPFGLKTGIHFSHFGLELGMVFEGTTGLYERIRKSNIRIRSVF